MQFILAFYLLQEYNHPINRRFYVLNKISKKIIGYRVKAAREIMGWSQSQLTKALGFNDRQSVSDIENGKRSLKPDELVALTDILNQDIEFFIDPFSVIGEAQFSWRASDELAEDKLDCFELKVGKWIGLIRWFRDTDPERTIDPLKYSLRLNAKSSFEDAIACAENLVDKLDLGLIPAERMIEKIENDLDIPIIFIDTIDTPEGHSISGATCHLQDLGVILINRNEPEARRFYNLTHELFHALTWDAIKPDHKESNSIEDRSGNKRLEQLADNFAAALLMPMRSLEHFIDRNKINDIEYLVNIAAKFHTSAIALSWRLYNLKWINDEMLTSLKKARQSTTSSILKPFSFSFINKLYHAIDCGKLSARKAAKTMGMNLTQFSELFIEHSLAVPFEV